MAGLLRTTLFLTKGLREFTRGGYERASKGFDNTAMDKPASLHDRRCMVTGANQGLGYQTSLELARRGATLFMVCRNEERGREAVEAVRKDTGNPDVCDLSSLAAIKALAEEWLASGQPLDVLVNNAGIMLHERTPSADGFESNFAVNTLAGFALTVALQPALHAAAAARVIFVSSGGQYNEPLVVTDLQAEQLKKYDGIVQYSRDKRRQVALAERFSERWVAAGLRSRAYSMHPGWTETEGVKTSIPGFYNSFKNKLRNLQQGCDTTVWLCVEDGGKLEPGAFYLDRRPQHKHLALAGTKYSAADVDALWIKLEGMAAPAMPALAPTA
ncbi:Dehydrogenase/reductase SDR family member 12 [Chlorella vulgaris]